MLKSNEQGMRDACLGSTESRLANRADEMAAAMISITTQEQQTRQRLMRPSLQNKIDPQNIASQLIQTYSGLRKS